MNGGRELTGRVWTHQDYNSDIPFGTYFNGSENKVNDTVINFPITRSQKDYVVNTGGESETCYASGEYYVVFGANAEGYTAKKIEFSRIWLGQGRDALYDSSGDGKFVYGWWFKYLFVTIMYKEVNGNVAPETDINGADSNSEDYYQKYPLPAEGEAAGKWETPEITTSSASATT